MWDVCTVTFDSLHAWSRGISQMLDDGKSKIEFQQAEVIIDWSSEAKGEIWKFLTFEIVFSPDRNENDR